jgi:amphi-Trp domain-containing protein
MSDRVNQDVEKGYPKSDAIAALRRLADALEQGTSFEIFLEGVRIFVPPDAAIEFEYEQAENERELEIELKWRH